MTDDTVELIDRRALKNDLCSDDDDFGHCTNCKWNEACGRINMMPEINADNLRGTTKFEFMGYMPWEEDIMVTMCKKCGTRIEMSNVWNIEYCPFCGAREE